MVSFQCELSFNETNLAFKGRKAKKGHITFCLESLTGIEVILFKKLYFLLIQTLSMVEYEWVYFTSAWPSWPLKANFFHQIISTIVPVLW